MTGPFPHERLVVYQRARQFYRRVIRLRSRLPRGLSDLYDQLTRAGGSVCHNLAEGAASYTPGNKLRYFRIALSSAGESAAALDRLEDHGVLSGIELDEARGIRERGRRAHRGADPPARSISGPDAAGAGRRRDG